MTELATKTENIAEVKEAGHETRPEPCEVQGFSPESTVVQGSHAPNVVHGGFEPEVLAFCCEH